MSGPPPPRGKRAAKTNLIRIGLTTPRPEVQTISPTARYTWRRWGRKRPITWRVRRRLDTRPLGFSAGGGGAPGGLVLGMEPLRPLPPPAGLPEEGAEEGAAPQAHGEDGAKEDHGIDALAPLPGPVHVLEIDPESEFVEGYGGCRPIGHGGELGGGALRTGSVAGADLDQPEVTGAPKAGDPEDQVMEVPAPDAEVVEGAD